MCGSRGHAVEACPRLADPRLAPSDEAVNRMRRRIMENPEMQEGMAVRRARHKLGGQDDMGRHRAQGRTAKPYCRTHSKFFRSWPSAYRHQDKKSKRGQVCVLETRMK